MPSHEGGVNIHAVMWNIMLYILMHTNRLLMVLRLVATFGSRRAAMADAHHKAVSACVCVEKHVC